MPNLLQMPSLRNRAVPDSVSNLMPAGISVARVTSIAANRNSRPQARFAHDEGPPFNIQLSPRMAASDFRQGRLRVGYCRLIKRDGGLRPGSKAVTAPMRGSPRVCARTWENRKREGKPESPRLSWLCGRFPLGLWARSPPSPTSPGRDFPLGLFSTARERSSPLQISVPRRGCAPVDTAAAGRRPKRTRSRCAPGG